MSNVYGFRDRATALAARKLVESQDAMPTLKSGPVPIRSGDAASRRYWIVPKGTIPARTNAETPGVGDAYLVEYSRDTGEFARTPWVNDAAKTVELEVYNRYGYDFAEDSGDDLKPLLEAVEDSQGNLFVVAPERKLIGVTAADIAFGSSGTINLYASATPGTAPTATGDTVTAWFDWIAEDSPEAIPANVDVAIELAEHGEYRIYHAACGERTTRAT